jgi:hypothetical protein
LACDEKSLFVADVAQLAEQLICNQQVASSILAVSSAEIVGKNRWGS